MGPALGAAKLKTAPLTFRTAVRPPGGHSSRPGEERSQGTPTSCRLSDPVPVLQRSGLGSCRHRGGGRRAPPSQYSVPEPRSRDGQGPAVPASCLG